MILVFVIGTVVDYLLIMGTGQLCGSCGFQKRTMLAAVAGGGCSALCLLPRFEFLGNFFCRMVSLAVVAVLAFGVDRGGLRRACVFLLLSLAVGNAVRFSGGIDPWSLLIICLLTLLLCVFGWTEDEQQFVPVELSYGKNSLRVTALRDTGNTLRDPITGKPVLILGADAAQQLTGLSPQQLRQPVEAMEALPGLRLIPYKAICGSGFLLALRFQNMRIGTWQGSGLVAFAPEVLNMEGKFQALTGGML